MAEFFCCICHSSFSIPDRTLARYGRWNPKYCLAHKDIARARSKPWVGRAFADAAREGRPAPIIAVARTVGVRSSRSPSNRSL